MDFAALMSAQISKSRSSATDNKSKYLRRSEVEAERQTAYATDQARLETEREERRAEKRKFEEEEAEMNHAREEKKRKLAEESKARREAEEIVQERLRRKRLGLPELAEKDRSEGTPLPEGEEDMKEEELRSKLRSLNEPAVLFDESHVSRLRRYRGLAQKAIAPKLSTTVIPTTLELLPESEMKLPEKVPSDKEPLAFLFRQLASYFTMILTEWELALSERDTSVKESHSGKQAYNAFVQSRENMRPLFKKFEKSSLEASILGPIVKIVNSAQQRRYVEANDQYLTLSIGKAAWPIGVTMVGIHERSAREKLHESDNQAHILSDEVTRKFLQSIKRCLSFAQTRWPPDDQLQLMG